MWKLPFNHTGLLAPQFAPGNLGEVRVGGRCTVRVEHLTIRVSALGLGSSLLVVLNFESDVLGYSFDAMGTTVETANHAHVRPSGYVGPGEMTWHSDHTYASASRPAVGPLGWSGARTPLGMRCRRGIPALCSSFPL